MCLWSEDGERAYWMDRSSRKRVRRLGMGFGFGHRTTLLFCIMGRCELGRDPGEDSDALCHGTRRALRRGRGDTCCRLLVTQQAKAVLGISTGLYASERERRETRGVCGKEAVATGSWRSGAFLGNKEASKMCIAYGYKDIYTKFRAWFGHPSCDKRICDEQKRAMRPDTNFSRPKD